MPSKAMDACRSLMGNHDAGSATVPGLSALPTFVRYHFSILNGFGPQESCIKEFDGETRQTVGGRPVPSGFSRSLVGSPTIMDDGHHRNFG
jgi:hypothetical protein